MAEIDGKEQPAVVVSTDKPEKVKISGIFKGFGKDLWQHALLPGLKNMGFEMLKAANNNALNRVSNYIFQGEKKPVSSGGFIPYNKIGTGSAQAPAKPTGNPRILSRKMIGDQLELVVNDENYANEILMKMFDEIESKGYMSVGDLFVFLEIAPPFTYYKWGWTNLIGAGVRQVQEGWYVDVPRVRALQ